MFFTVHDNYGDNAQNPTVESSGVVNQLEGLSAGRQDSVNFQDASCNNDGDSINDRDSNDRDSINDRESVGRESNDSLTNEQDVNHRPEQNRGSGLVRVQSQVSVPLKCSFSISWS